MDTLNRSRFPEDEEVDVRAGCLSLTVVFVLLLCFFCLFIFCSCRTTHKYEESSTQTVTRQSTSHQADTQYFARIDSFLRSWSVQMEGFEADISIPLKSSSADEDVSADTAATDTAPSAPSGKPQPPRIDIHIRANSLNASGEDRGRGETKVTNSSKSDKDSSSQWNGKQDKKKKTTRRPAFWWWAGAAVFMLVVVYAILRWLRKG